MHIVSEMFFLCSAAGSRGGWIVGGSNRLGGGGESLILHFKATSNKRGHFIHTTEAVNVCEGLEWCFISS